MAKRFTFRLETVLTLRKRSEDRQRRAVAERLRDLQQSRERLSGLHQRAADTIARVRSGRRQDEFDVLRARQEHQWHGHLKRRIADQRQEIKDLQTTLDRERAELARRSKDRKAIDKLRERQLLAHQTEQNRRERAESDECATQMFMRQRRNRQVDRLMVGA